MSVIPVEDRMLSEIILLNKRMDRVTELLSAMNGNLASIKSNTTKGGGIMGG